MAKEYSYGLCPYIIMNGNFYILLNKTSTVSDFNFFKGKIENNETISECALREFKEETGVLVNKDDLEDYFFQRSPRKDVGIFLVNWDKYKNKDFSFQKSEIWSTAWVPLKGITTSKNQQKICNDIELFIKDKEQSLKHIIT